MFRGFLIAVTAAGALGLAGCEMQTTETEEPPAPPPVEEAPPAEEAVVDASAEQTTEAQRPPPPPPSDTGDMGDARSSEQSVQEDSETVFY